jgi:hypothetical protein
VQKPLQWIVCSEWPLSIAALCEAVAIEEGDEFLDKEFIREEDEILLHCSSLIRRSAATNDLDLAHYTVKESLTGIDPKSIRPLALYSIQRDDVRRLARRCLTYLNLQDFQSDLPENLENWKKQCDQCPFRLHADFDWDDYASQCWDDPSLLSLAKDLFKPCKT